MRLILPMVLAAMALAGCASPSSNPPTPQSTAGKALPPPAHVGGAMGGG